LALRERAPLLAGPYRPKLPGVDTFLEILEIRLSDLIMSPETGRTPSINIGICESDRAAIAGGRLSERTLAGHGDQTMWDKYGPAKLAGKGFETNTLIMECAAANNSIPALQKRGVVFMSCHNAIWEYTAKLIETGVNPDESTRSRRSSPTIWRPVSC
jgi:hypothetical protein